MNVISNSRPSNGNKIIEQKFIQRVLTEEATNIFEAQDRVFARFNFSDKDNIILHRRFTVTGTTLEVTHAMRARFIDMKRIRGLKRKPIPNHNTIIYGHFNNIINQLAFGFTDDIKQLIAQEHKIHL